MRNGNVLAFDVFAAKVKHGIQDPLTPAGDAAEQFLRRLGPMGVCASAAAAASLEEFGEPMALDIQNRGVTREDIRKFQAAMKKSAVRLDVGLARKK